MPGGTRPTWARMAFSGCRSVSQFSVVFPGAPPSFHPKPKSWLFLSIRTKTVSLRPDASWQVWSPLRCSNVTPFLTFRDFLSLMSCYIISIFFFLAVFENYLFLLTSCPTPVRRAAPMGPRTRPRQAAFHPWCVAAPPGSWTTGSLVLTCVGWCQPPPAWAAMGTKWPHTRTKGKCVSIRL